MIVGYTTMMAPEAMGLPFLECLASWAQVCDKIAICYSTFPKLDLEIPTGAVKPWEYDGALEILEKFDEEVLGGKLVVIKHEWNPNFPREDGLTKQMARELALKQFIKLDGLSWTIQFDADEILRDEDAVRVFEFVNEQEKDPSAMYATMGILEMFGGTNQVRFGFGNWIKIRMMRNTPDFAHDMVLWARDRNEKTGQIVAKDNRDDGAGVVWIHSLNRPDYNQGRFLFNPQAIMVGNTFARGQNIPALQAENELKESLNTGCWIFHTSWIDIPRKWRMGWFFDNFWSVLNGKQDTFTEKAELAGTFTHTREPENLDEELAIELKRPGLIQISDNEYPSVFETVKEWRKTL
jgi:hypothetical protein